MSEKNFYNNYEYQEDYEMRCDCKYDYDDEKRPDDCECNPEGNCCNGVTFDDPIVNKDVIISTNEVFDNKLTCSVPLLVSSISSIEDATITQRYVPIEECGCKSCDSLQFSDSAVYKVEKATVKIINFNLTSDYASGTLTINEDTVTDLYVPDKVTDTVKVGLYDLPSLLKNNCHKKCKGTKATLMLTEGTAPYKLIIELCGTVFTCGRKAKFFVTIEDIPEQTIEGLSAFLCDLCIPSLDAFEKPYIEFSARAEGTITGKPIIEAVVSTDDCLPELTITNIKFLFRAIFQCKVVVPVQRLMQSKGLFVPDNFEQCCNIPNIYPTQVEDNC